MLRLLDLYCGCGGAAKGYHLAGFDSIVGVDIEPIENYPFHFIQEDALEYIWENDLSEFDLIHASPPCQGYTWANHHQYRPNHSTTDIEELRSFFESISCFYVIENVSSAPLKDPIILEGNMFELPIVKRRLFETNWPCSQPEIRKYQRHISKFVTVAGMGGTANSYKLQHWMMASGIWWMSKKQIVQAIPPKYTKFIGERFIHYYYNEFRKENFFKGASNGNAGSLGQGGNVCS
jgi:DNA (cytosine-5)-methyltransferase 1